MTLCCQSCRFCKFRLSLGFRDTTHKTIGFLDRHMPDLSCKISNLISIVDACVKTPFSLGFTSYVTHGVLPPSKSAALPSLHLDDLAALLGLPAGLSRRRM